MASAIESLCLSSVFWPGYQDVFKLLDFVYSLWRQITFAGWWRQGDFNDCMGLRKSIASGILLHKPRRQWFFCVTVTHDFDDQATRLIGEHGLGFTMC